MVGLGVIKIPSPEKMRVIFAHPLWSAQKLSCVVLFILSLSTRNENRTGKVYKMTIE